MAIKGVHALFYTTEPDAARAFLRDKLGLPAYDSGDGWLIFHAPEADIGCHPADRPVPWHLVLLRGHRGDDGRVAQEA